jgi:hypothetical protein
MVVLLTGLINKEAQGSTYFSHLKLFNHSKVPKIDAERGRTIRFKKI